VECPREEERPAWSELVFDAFGESFSPTLGFETLSPRP